MHASECFELGRVGDKWILTGGILPEEAVRVGQRWLSSEGHEVEVLAVHDDWITYTWDGQHEWDKDNVSFQCKYSLIL